MRVNVEHNGGLLNEERICNEQQKTLTDQESINGYLTPELQLRAEEELQEKAQWRLRDVQALRDLLREDEDLHCRMDEEFLLMFLRARKFDYERAACLVQQYYLIRKNNPSLFVDLKPSVMTDVFSQQLQTVLPHRDPQGRQVFVFRAGLWDPSKCSVDSIFQSNVICLEHCIRSVETQVCGMVALVDLSGFSFAHIRNFTTKDAKRMMSVIQDCFPVRFAGFHFINHPWVFNVAFNLVSPFLSEKVKTRTYFHGYCLDYLHKYLPPSILPKEYGGSQPSFDNSSFYKTLLEEESYYENMNRYGYIGELACQRYMESDGLLGAYYSFCSYKPSSQEE